MKQKLCLTLLFILFVKILFSQIDYKSGWVLTNQKDTIFGEIDNKPNRNFGRFCSFRKNKSEPTIEYSPDKLLAYRISKESFFVSREIKKNKVFLEFLIKGKINFFSLIDDEGGEHFFLEKNNSGLLEIPYFDGITSSLDTISSFDIGKHKGFLYYFMQETPSLRSCFKFE